MESVVVVENTPIESTLEKDEKTDDRIVVHGEEYTLEEIVELMDAQIEQLYETPQATRTSTCLEFLSYLQSAIRKPPRNVKKEQDGAMAKMENRLARLASMGLVEMIVRFLEVALYDPRIKCTPSYYLLSALTYDGDARTAMVLCFRADKRLLSHVIFFPLQDDGFIHKIDTMLCITSVMVALIHTMPEYATVYDEMNTVDIMCRRLTASCTQQFDNVHQPTWKAYAKETITLVYAMCTGDCRQWVEGRSVMKFTATTLLDVDVSNFKLFTMQAHVMEHARKRSVKSAKKHVELFKLMYRIDDDVHHDSRIQLILDEIEDAEIADATAAPEEQ